MAVVKHLPHLGQFGEIASHSVFDKILRLAAGGCSKLLKLRFSFRFQMQNHTCSLETRKGTVTFGAVRRGVGLEISVVGIGSD